MADQLAIPTLQELVSDSAMELKENALVVLTNQDPPTDWLSKHPLVKVKNANGENVPLEYLPINRVEYLLSKIYRRWWLEVKDAKSVANSCVVVVRLWVVNPISGKEEFQDGVGAAPMQTEKDAGAMEWDKIKSSAVQIGMPAAESYAFKDAAEKFGKIFGRDLGRKDTMDYINLLKKTEDITKDDIINLMDLKKEVMSAADVIEANRIINKNEENSFKKLHKKLAAL